MWRVLFGGALALCSTTATAQASAQQPLNLTCGGAGTANKITHASGVTNVQVSGIAGGTLVSGSGSGTTFVNIPRQQAFEDQVDVRLFSGDDRIRMPRTMLPPVHGGSDGWFKLKDVRVDARSIHAEVAVNFINHPKVYIDRVTGTISISGRAGDYTGECQAADANAPAKF
jgi:hypothetical protein